MIKTSPLSGIYRNHPVNIIEVSGWHVAGNFGDVEKEQEYLKKGAVLVDWSHIGKISLSRGNASTAAEKILKGSSKIEPLSSIADLKMVALRLTKNDYLILCQPGMEKNIFEKIDSNLTTVTDQSGSNGCLVLGGPRRDEVLERSTAVDLRRDRVVSGTVVQSSIHTINMTLYRTNNFDVIVHPRNLSESLYDALMDVGIGVGLVPAGVETIPVSFEKEK